ncbi:DUF4865 family protein [Pseudomonas costantinii]|uniref:DUF4865 domain-containing protein n=1 Tax=Pseudomonas costantinii TaxID=168469 RepID=A0A1S2VBS7_9PSED|nr:DUF4865 family protein [Pseudomonas costantinii]NVZ20574.1 DUF4865 family protein [Pseudomonas costantinii]OIN55398.1 DUF4865 domain-containing protein [Pseudomonas costantinii]SED34506.1 protein of unknown function [Pseudomonas costantinii]
MFAKQYSHRLPADYDMGVIRQRAAQLGPLWDHTEGLLFKAFIAQERGQGPGVGNLYASVYLWSDPLQAADFLLGERFQKVLDSFGRPPIESWLPLDVQRGPAQNALSLYREEWPLEPGADRAGILAQEKLRNQQLADSRDTFAVFLALDVQAWRWVRITLSAKALDAGHPGTGYQVLYLAQGVA